jgi:hypothetical protein
VTDPSDYVRQVETYLCQKNRGHLVRVVGPAFELVRGWVSSGVPLKVALRGIDRCVERHDARGPRRRPLRIEFCEADVLDLFDEWRRAVGVTAAIAGEETDPGGPPEGHGRRPPLLAHIERAIARLAYARGGEAPSPALRQYLEEVIRELEAMAASAPRVRGEARAVIVARLAELDAALIGAAAEGIDEALTDRLRREADEELAPFGARMPDDARARTRAAAFQRLLRESLGLPTLTYEHQS